MKLLLGGGALALAAGALAVHNAVFDVCWKDTVDRGIGRPIHTCADGLEQDGLLCYPYCDSIKAESPHNTSYYGVGPVCWESCEEYYTDMGVFCDQPLKIISADNSACPWYDVCGLTFAQGCSTCPDPDPGYRDYINDGCTCRRPERSYTKDSFGRTAGVPLGCSDDEDEDAGLCYDKCSAHEPANSTDVYDGVGPVCWWDCGANSATAHAVDGGAICCNTSEDCTDKILELTLTLPLDIVEAILRGDDWQDIVKDVKSMVDALLGFVMPMCSDLR